jgi:hypothetical protein
MKCRAAKVGESKMKILTVEFVGNEASTRLRREAIALA